MTRKGWRTALCVALSTWVLPHLAAADVVTEAPWHPIAKAYLSAIFVSELRPIDWAGIADRYSATDRNDQGGKSVYRLIDAVSGGAPAAAAMRAAIARRDRDALRVAATRAQSGAVRHYLEDARTALATRPAAALKRLLLAQEMYRPFARFIREADPDGFRRLGMAWLDLSTLAGRGIAKGAMGEDRERSFAESAAVVERYLIAQYEKADAASIARRGPVPAAGKALDPRWRPAPWLPPDANIADQNPLPRLVLNFEKAGVDERKLFMVSLGDLAFDSPQIFGEPARSLGIACSTCHNRSDVNATLFVPGLSRRPGGIDVDSSHFNRRANDMRVDPIDVPSLRGIRFTAPYGRNGRTASLREFTRNVIVGEFGGREPTPLVLDALVAYMNEFEFLPTPYLQRDGRLNGRAGAAARRGEAIFNRPFGQMGGQSCASCHIPSAHFLDGRRHAIGGTDDEAMDTPTLLGVAHTAPYFHDGRLDSLRAVVEWFDRRFGLGLDEGERRDLTAYVEAVGTGEKPFETFDARNTRFRLDFTELSTFLSTLDELIPARDATHARIVVRTVVADLARDTAGLADIRTMPKVYELTAILTDLDRAIEAGAWDRAAVTWDRYKRKEAEYANELY